MKLEFLSHLDLSENDFHVIRIPSIQYNITHTSNLMFIDLSFNSFHMDSLNWLSPLSSLKYLYLNEIHLHKESNWFQAVTSLPSFLELHLRYCKLNNFMIDE